MVDTDFLHPRGVRMAAQLSSLSLGAQFDERRYCCFWLIASWPPCVDIPPPRGHSMANIWARLWHCLCHFLPNSLTGTPMAVAEEECGAGLWGMWVSCVLRKRRRTWIWAFREYSLQCLLKSQYMFFLYFWCITTHFDVKTNDGILHIPFSLENLE